MGGDVEAIRNNTDPALLEDQKTLKGERQANTASEQALLRAERATYEKKVDA